MIARQYNVPRGLIGVVHLPAMPGDPGCRSSFEEVEAFALRDIEALVSGGADAIIVENFGSSPFPKGTAGARTAPHQVALMSLVVRAAKRALKGPVGVNCLRNDGLSALGIAAAAGADFIRVNVLCGAWLCDQGVIEGEADLLLRARDALGADVAILADVFVKHAAPLANFSPEEVTKDTLLRAHADAVIVTGRATGAPIDIELFDAIADAAGEAPVLLGSGVTPDNLDRLAPHIHGAIVGTWTKENGSLFKPIDPERVKTLKARFSELGI